MMSKAPRWNDPPVNIKINKTAQKKAGKEGAAALTPCATKPAGGDSGKLGVGSGRSNILGNRSADLRAAVTKVGGSLRGGGPQAAGPTSRRSRPALRLCSSKSFSSLHAPSLPAAPFMRSSRSLNRLDQRSPAEEDSDHATANSQVKKLPTTGKNYLSGRRSASVEQIRDKSHSDNSDRMKTSSSSQALESSPFLVSTAACHHQKENKQSRDGVYTLCAMTSGMRHNWVQAVLKNVRPGLTQDVASSLTEQQTTHWTNDSNPQLQEQETAGRPRSSPDGGSSSSHLNVPPSTNLVENSGVPQTGVSDASRESQDGDSASTVAPQTDELFHGELSMQSSAESNLKQNEIPSQTGEQQVSVNVCDRTKNEDTLPSETQTAQLLKELEQTQRELSRLQQINKMLQEELQQERESHAREQLWLQNDTSSTSENTLTFQRLQKINQELRSELEAQKRSQEEARESELRRRVDLLAQQAQLLVTGDATALAQAHLEQDRKRFQEQQVEWETCVTSLKAQQDLSEEQKKEAESRLTQLQQELQSCQSLQQEAEQLRQHLQDVSTQFHAYEEAQAQKEGRLQKHLALLQASQERERRSLSASLTQAEQHSQQLQERLDRAEEQVESFHRTREVTEEIEEAQRQLQEELTCTVSAVQQLQEERDQLRGRCQELQSQLSDADSCRDRLQGRLETDETHYYNLEHSHEKACEELQVALGRVQQRECETQEIREGYERLLDRKEQELSEVLLKMEVLGNSLEETEVKLSEVVKACTCASSNHKAQSAEPVSVNDIRSKMSNSSHVPDGSPQHARPRSRSIDASYQCVVVAAAAEYEPERFMSVIQSLETKLYVTEEKLRDITQRLEEHQSDTGCQDPQLCSQLTQSRATAQHLSLMLHTQAKHSQRFAQETESRCRVLAGRFQVALNLVEACRGVLQGPPVDLLDLDRQLSTAAACLQQGEIDAEKQQRGSREASKGESKILNEGILNGAENDASPKSDRRSLADDEESVEKCLTRELFVVGKMVSALQSPHVVSQLSSLSQEDERYTVNRYRAILSERIALKLEEKFECDSNETFQGSIVRVFIEAELIYAALRFQLQDPGEGQAHDEEVERLRTGLADITPPELAPYEEQVQVDSECSEEATTAKQKEQKEDQNLETEMKPLWLNRLLSRLQRRREFLRRLCQEMSDDCRPAGVCSVDDGEENVSGLDLSCIQEQVKLIYLSDRLYLDVEKELHQVEAMQNNLQTRCKDQNLQQTDEPDAFNDALCRLQEDNDLLRDGLERAEQKITTSETGNQRLLEDMKETQDYHKEQIQKVESEFQEKIEKLQQIHEEEMKDLHGYYSKSCVSKEEQSKSRTETESGSSVPNQTKMEGNKPGDDGTSQTVGIDSEAMREAFQKDLLKLKESCEQEFSEMEEAHRKQMEDLHQRHQKEVTDLRKEKDQLLQEETAATMSAIVAMRRAHKHELEKTRRSQRIRESADITQLCSEYEGEIHFLQKELEMLSAQHTEKCLESSQLSRELQDERKSTSQCQKENQELRKTQREKDEQCQRQLSLNGKQMHVVPQVNDFYEMEVILRAREAEMQFLRQEAQSLREELKIARMDKIYAQNKLKTLSMNHQEEPRQHVNSPGDDFQLAAWSQSSREASGQNLKDSVTNKHNAALPKKAEKPSLLRQIRGARSKSLKEGLSLQERMKLFESF